MLCFKFYLSKTMAEHSLIVSAKSFHSGHQTQVEKGVLAPLFKLLLRLIKPSRTLWKSIVIDKPARLLVIASSQVSIETVSKSLDLVLSR